MVSRLQFLTDFTQRTSSRGRTGGQLSYAALIGWLFISGLSFTFLLWLTYRWLGQPTWPEHLPGWANEWLTLGEGATALTLASLWFWLGLRRRRSQAKPAPDAASLIDEPVTSVEQIYALSPQQFEEFVGVLFRQRGYEAIVQGGSGDHGVDLEVFAPDGRRAIVQCKRYRDTVGERTVRELYGTLIHEQAVRAFLVTTAEISDSARAWARYKPLSLIDGARLVELVTYEREP